MQNDILTLVPFIHLNLFEHSGTRVVLPVSADAFSAEIQLGTA